MNDTRIWMYRGDEAVCFDCRDSVPDGEGWTDTPEPMSVPKEEGGGPSGSPRESEQSRLDRLRRRATALGIPFHRNTGTRKLERLIKQGERNGAQS